MTHEEQWKDVFKETREQTLTEEQNRELKLYLYMLLWKETFCKDYEPNWEDLETLKYLIDYSNTQNKYCVGWFYSYKFNLQVYLPTKELAEQMLQDLKDVGVIKE